MGIDVIWQYKNNVVFWKKGASKPLDEGGLHDVAVYTYLYNTHDHGLSYLKEDYMMLLNPIKLDALAEVVCPNFAPIFPLFFVGDYHFFFLLCVFLIK